VKLTIRVPADLHAKLEALKERDGITLQGAGVVALREYLKKRGA
jgi:hypothetical protein